MGIVSEEIHSLGFGAFRKGEREKSPLGEEPITKGKLFTRA